MRQPSCHGGGDVYVRACCSSLLKLPMKDNVFHLITGPLLGLEGCYLYFDQHKCKWIRSSKTSGEGRDACFEGRGRKHQSNATSKDQMRIHRLYSEYPASGIANLGAVPVAFFSVIISSCRPRTLHVQNSAAWMTNYFADKITRIINLRILQFHKATSMSRKYSQGAFHCILLCVVRTDPPQPANTHPPPVIIPRPPEDDNHARRVVGAAVSPPLSPPTAQVTPHCHGASLTTSAGR